MTPSIEKRTGKPGAALRRTARRWLADSAATAAVEFAMIAPLLIALTLGAIQLGLIFFGTSELERITQKSARNVMLGGAQGMSSGQFQSAVCANVVILFDCSGLMISLSPATSAAAPIATPQLTFDANGNVTNTFPFNPGASSSTMVLQVLYRLPVLAGPMFTFANSNGDILLTSTAVFVNEPQ